MSDATFVCDKCQTVFASRNTLFRHLREAHVGVDRGEVEDPPSKQWEAERKPAPSVHAQKKGQKENKKGKGNTAKKEEKPKEAKQLEIETRPEKYHEELRSKTKALCELLSDAGNGPLPEAEVFESPPEHFRMRAEFDIQQGDADVGPRYIMHAGRERVVVDSYPFACEPIYSVLMPGLLEGLRRHAVLREQLFQVCFHASLSGDAVVSLLYRTARARAERRERTLQQGLLRAAACELPEDPKLTDEWENAARDISETLLRGASVVGKTRGRKRVVGRDWVQEEFHVQGCRAPLRYWQLEGFFSQPNGKMCEHMLAWTRAAVVGATAAVGDQDGQPPRTDDLLELYCGNGNFCVALAPLFRRVFATELVKELLDTVMINAADNGVSNIEVGRVSAEELALAMDNQRCFSRLQHVDFAAYNFRTVLVDPPRAGLGPEVSSFLQRFDRVVYVSCCPETLREDLVTLCRTHDIKRLAAFDQFPYTGHLELGLLLERRPQEEPN
eukprot:TRINITY_DN21718_c0_g2_i1.p1 TRINITY_DN21718_c0_g2~~TRINITY_DN21718_c0_g2_i1.p1  ORF type:complete len:500 (+),score=120.68 TRINITY_DN21718_c0_g2_i1:81-1580(+)